ncbi:NAD(P)-dependent oxidoreductase [bacterium]|nr:NAD(P)-dependent oxidoreductase [bacterium]
MRILITGGTGFLGSSLSRRHLEAGDEVRIIAKEATELEARNSHALRQAGVEVRVGDFADEGLLRDSLRGVDRVVHIAAAMREANVGDEHFWNVNVRATERLLQFSRDAGVDRFVYCSTAGVVGTERGIETDEETDPAPKDIYQTTKLAAERAVLAFGRENDYAVTAVRPPGVYGPGDGRLVKLFKMVQKGWFLLPGGGQGKHHMVFIDDLLDAFDLAATKPDALGRVYNAAGPRAVPLVELVDEIARVLGTEYRRVPVPFAPLDLVATACEQICQPFGIQPPIYPRRLDFYRHDENFSTARAARELGWAPKHSLAEGLKKTADAYREQELL